jgi:hypothetical protein
MNDHQLQQRLLETELSPPGRVWDLLAAELDELQQLTPAATQLNAAEITPPEAAWATITTAIEEQNSGQWVRESLEHAELQPPAKVWSELEAHLTEQEIGHQLAHLQVPAPAATWERIRHQLEEASGAKGKAPVIKLRTWLQIAAAAVVTGLLLWGSTFLRTSNLEHNEMPVATKQEPTPTPLPPAQPSLQQTTEPEAAVVTRKSKHPKGSKKRCKCRYNIQSPCYRTYEHNCFC